MSVDDYDILVIGGGLAGASLAAALADSDVRIGLVEAVPPEAPTQPSYDDRGIALAYGSRQIFAGIGVWPYVDAVANLSGASKSRIAVVSAPCVWIAMNSVLTPSATWPWPEIWGERSWNVSGKRRR